MLALLRDEVLRCRDGLFTARTNAVLARARYEDGELMPVDDVVDRLVTRLVGGHETTANTLAWTLYHFLAHPALERARDESRAAAARAARVPFLDVMIKDSMRLTPIAPDCQPQSTPAAPPGRVRRSAGTILWPCVYLADRRREVWPEPSHFRPASWSAPRRLRSSCPSGWPSRLASAWPSPRGGRAAGARTAAPGPRHPRASGVPRHHHRAVERPAGHHPRGVEEKDEEGDGNAKGQRAQGRHGNEPSPAGAFCRGWAPLRVG